MKYFLSIDFGGTSIKIILFDEGGRQKAVKHFLTKKIEERLGYREIELDELWINVSQTIKLLLQDSQVSAEQIQCVSCVGHGKGLYLLDKDHKEFTNGILSADERGKELAEEFERKVTAIWDKTKQHVVASQSPVLLYWLKKNEPAIYGQIGVILSAKDYLRFKLTDCLNQEYGDASGNQLINFNTNNYDKEILEFFEISEMKNKLPKLVGGNEIVGGVSQKASVDTGLKEGTPVVGGLFDIHACAIGSGVLDDSMFSVIAGTWSVNTFPSKKPAPYQGRLMTSLYTNNSYLIESSSPTSAGNLDIILKMLMSEEIRNSVVNDNKSAYQLLEEFLQNTDASFSKIIFLPFLYGSNMHPNAESAFLGLTTTSTKSEMIRAVYEGIVFAHKQHIEELIKVRGEKPREIRLSGGAANSKNWCQMFADILEIPVVTIKGDELGGLGGAIVAKQALTNQPLEVLIQEMVKIENHYIPEKSQFKKYRLKYKVYQDVLMNLEHAWNSIKKLN